jgi:SatD family (SatD)
MIAIITGDIVRSNKVATHVWNKVLKDVLKTLGNTPKNWEMYRGDEFQIELTDINDALWAALLIKSTMLSYANLDVRICIGLGDKEQVTKKITESNGTAFQRSGRGFEDLKKNKITMAIYTGIDEIDVDLNTVIHLAYEGFIDSWSQTSADMVRMMLENKSKSQSEVAAMANLAQSAVSRRLKRAKYDLVNELLDYYQRQLVRL